MKQLVLWDFNLPQIKIKENEALPSQQQIFKIILAFNRNLHKFNKSVRKINNNFNLSTKITKFFRTLLKIKSLPAYKRIYV